MIDEFDRRSQLRRLLTETKKRAKLKRLRFDLDFKWLERTHDRQGGRCALTNVEFVTHRAEGLARNPFAPSIDRISSRGGYLKRNCRLVCCAANLALGEWGEDVFARIAHGYVMARFA